MAKRRDNTEDGVIVGFRQGQPIYKKSYENSDRGTSPAAVGGTVDRSKSTDGRSYADGERGKFPPRSSEAKSMDPNRRSKPSHPDGSYADGGVNKARHKPLTVAAEPGQEKHPVRKTADGDGRAFSAKRGNTVDGPRPKSKGGASRSGWTTKDGNPGKKPEYPFKTRDEQEAEREKKVPRQQVDEHPMTNEDELPYLVMGRNAVREALRSGRSIDRILVIKEQDGSLGELIAMARDRQLQVREVARGKLDELCMPFGHGGRTGNHQGIVAQVPGVEYCDIADILDVARERGEPPFVILLDGIEDPHNLGSIIRSAECAGAHGVIIPKRRASGVTAAACKASAGAVEYMKVARVSNLSGAILRLKDAGLWIAGADMQGIAMASANLKGAIGLVIGGEGGGCSKLIKENCDFLVSIPMAGKLDSLNAAVAAAILMFEKRRQDQ